MRLYLFFKFNEIIQGEDYDEIYMMLQNIKCF